MQIKKRTFFLGIFISIVPFLGLPTFWKSFFVIFCGITLVLFSIKINFPKNIIRNKIKKETGPILVNDNIPIYHEEKKELTPIVVDSIIKKLPRKRKIVAKDSISKKS